MSITSKRKAQDLVREGKIHDAIGKLREGLADGDPDPYDHVYLGDLLMRVGETADSLSAYQKAIRSYEDVGLYRNAVAIGKKMLRIDCHRPEIHRCLASLYDREGLHGEAIPHYLTYLDSFVGEEVPPTEFLETLDQAASITGSKVEVALRLAEHFIRIRRGDRAAALLEDVAANAEIGGSADMAEELRRRARDLRGLVSADESDNGAAPPPLPAAEHIAGVEFSAAADADSPEFLPPPPPLGEVEPISFDPGTIEAALEDERHSSSSGGGELPGPPTVELDDLPSPHSAMGAFELGGADGSDDQKDGLSGSSHGLDSDGADDESDDPFLVEHFAGSHRNRGVPGSLGDERERDLGAIDLDLAGDGSADPGLGNVDANPGFAGVSDDLGFGEVTLPGGSARSDRDSSEDDSRDAALPRSPRPKTTAMTFDAHVLDSAASPPDSPDDDDLGEDHVYEIELDEEDTAAFELTPVPETPRGAPTALRGGAAALVDDGESADLSAEDLGDEDDPDRGDQDEDDESELDAPRFESERAFGQSRPQVPASPVPTADGLHESAAPAGGAEDGTHDPPSESVVSIDEANDAFLAGRWSEARRLYEEIIEEQPDNRRILARLVETVRYLQDHHGEVHYLVQLGEVWIAEDELEEALECFLAVVHLDPENATAKRRLSRFREMGVRGAEVIEESDSNSVHGVLETGRSEVSVREAEESFRSEDWVELEGLLEEFKDGLKSQMDEEDYQGHYDLAVAYHGMGLLEEALEAADRALVCETIPLASERLARELKGSCLNELHRYREAVHEYREGVEKAGTDRQSRRTALYHLARSLEALEEWQEALDTYVRLRLEAPGFLDVEERIRTCEAQQGDSSSRPPSEAA